MMALLKKTLLFFLKVRIIPTFPFSNIGTIFRLIFPWIKYLLKNLMIFCLLYIAVAPSIIKSRKYDKDGIEVSIKAILCVLSMSHTNIKTWNRECSWMWKKLEPLPYNFYYRAFAKTVCHCLLAYDLTMQYPIRNCMEVFPPPDLIFRLLWHFCWPG